LTNLFDASAGASCGTRACKPFGGSLAIARSLGTPSFVGLVAAGGADWVDTSASASYSLYAIDATATGAVSPLFTRSLGTLAVPVPFGGGTTQTMPLRTYGEATIAGSDLYINGTTLSIGDVQQLLQPTLYGGIWGEGIRFSLSTTPTSGTVSTANYLVPTGSYGGGAGAMAVGGSTVIEIGAGKIFQHALTATEQATTAPNSSLKITPTITRSFKVTSWFQLGE
jgi:hypothetical protein